MRHFGLYNLGWWTSPISLLLLLLSPIVWRTIHAMPMFLQRFISPAPIARYIHFISPCNHHLFNGAQFMVCITFYSRVSSNPRCFHGDQTMPTSCIEVILTLRTKSMIRAGILSDTHLSAITPEFRALCNRAFADCSVIFHAGDMVRAGILEVFTGKQIHGVHGNMCDYSTHELFPEEKKIMIDGVTIGLSHGAGSRFNIEERVWSRFPEADVIIYGHTHQPVCQKRGGVWFINPGCFQWSSPHGAPASYATMTINNGVVDARLHTITL